MSRPLHFELSGGLYHVTSRGAQREDIYLDDLGREIWLEILSQVCERYHRAIHARCQVTNHYHTARTKSVTKAKRCENAPQPGDKIRAQNQRKLTDRDRTVQ